MENIVNILQTRGLHPKGEIDPPIAIEHVTEVSGQCRPGSLFVAIQGSKADGHAYLEDAARHGAQVALVSDSSVKAPRQMTLIVVDDTRRALGPVAQAVAGDPSRSMDVVGVTGTNGKTTVAYLVEKMLETVGRRPGMMGTILTRWAGNEIPAEETTPSGARIAQHLKTMLAADVNSVVMEVSSHGIDQHRLDGIRFRAMALTNVSQDHLDYHATMEQYKATKMAIFKRMREDAPDALAVVNVDDPTGRKIAEQTKREHLLTYGIRARKADLEAESILFSDNGLCLNLQYHGDRFSIHSPLHCYFNANNLMTATALSLSLGIEFDAIDRGARAFRGAPGRFEFVDGLPGIQVIVDYAHTPDALAQLLLNARSFARGKLIVVFGCGGDRDRGKRAPMGKVAAELGHALVVTNDNPRTEDPQRIIDEILVGVNGIEPKMSSHEVIMDRREAIAWAIDAAVSGDAVVIAGKGHEDYQILGTEKIHFDDRETVREIIAERTKSMSSKSP